MDWCGNVDHVQIMLLTAVTGVGKSTIAYTITHSCAERNVLLSSCFFKEGKIMSPRYLWSSMSLAIRSKSYHQMLMPLHHRPPPADIIVIDTLDKCDKATSLTLSKELPCCLKIFVTLWPVRVSSCEYQTFKWQEPSRLWKVYSLASLGAEGTLPGKLQTTGLWILNKS